MNILPPIFDSSGDVIPMDPEESYIQWFAILASHHAGGWHPESLPGQKAMSEFVAFVRETQARALESFVLTTNVTELTALQVIERARTIRASEIPVSGFPPEK